MWEKNVHSSRSAFHNLTICFISHSKDNFWSPVIPGHHIGGHHKPSACCSGQTKVQDFQGAVWFHNYIAWLQVLWWMYKNIHLISCPYSSCEFSALIAFIKTRCKMALPSWRKPYKAYMGRGEGNRSWGRPRVGGIINIPDILKHWMKMTEDVRMARKITLYPPWSKTGKRGSRKE